MTGPDPTPALLDLRALHAPPATSQDVRVLRQRGSCSIDAPAVTLDLDVPVAHAACDGACWAAPAATVLRPGHRHRFARLDRGVPDDLAACVRGECDEPQAGSGALGLTARLGRNDGTLADVLAQGGYAAYAIAAALAQMSLIEVIARAGLLRRLNARALVAPALEVTVTASAPDTHLLEGDPHRLIEGVLVACRAGGSRTARIHLADAAPNARTALRRALDDARAAGIVDGTALGGDAITIELDEERGSSVASVQTLCALTTAFDTPPPPTRLIALAGDLPRPGVYEVPVGGTLTWFGVLAMVGTTPARVQAIRIEGLEHLVRPEAFDVALDGSTLGSGEVTVLGPDADL